MIAFAVWALFMGAWAALLHPLVRLRTPRVPRSGVVSGYVEGWRRWRLRATPEGVRLQSVWNRSIWPARTTMVARGRLCYGGPGLYAYRRLGDVVYDAMASNRYDRRPFERAAPLVLGRVALWRRVIECEDGWQGEVGYPQALYTVGLPDDVRTALARDYGIEVYRLSPEELCALAARDRRHPNPAPL